jgi:hypothetical protein
MAESELEVTRSKTSFKGQVTKLKNKVDAIDTGAADELRTRELLADHERKYHEVLSLRKRGFSTILDETKLQKFDEDIDTIEDALFEIRVKLLKILQPFEKKVKKEEAQPNSQVTNKFKLPEIPIPVFNGEDGLSWMSFREMFNERVGNNPALNNVQKLHYLKEALKGEAEHLKSYGDTFESLWEAAVNRYENKRVIAEKGILGILELKPMAKESASEMKSLLNSVMKHVRALRTLGFQVENLSELFLISIVASKLDRNSRKLYEMGVAKKKEFPKWLELQKFMEDQLRILENLEGMNRCNDVEKKKIEIKKPSAKAFVLSGAEDSSKCIVCKTDHKLESCEKFKSLSIKERFVAVRNSGICMNCFAKGHSKKDCPEKGCKLCKFEDKHHELLHYTKKSNNNNEDQKPKTENVHHLIENLHIPSQDQQVLLSTAVVHVFDAFGNKHPCRILLDNGSQCHFITERMALKLRLQQMSVDKTIGGLSGKVTTRIHKSASVTIQSRFNERFFDLNCYIVNKVTNYTPAERLMIPKSMLPKNIELADPQFDNPAGIDMLVGAEYFFDIFLNGKLEMDGLPTFKETVFGWTAVGKVTQNKFDTNSEVCHLSALESINETMKKFWEIESTGTGFDKPQEKCLEEKMAEEHFKKTHYRNANGMYFVRLPLKCGLDLLESNYDNAKNQLDRLMMRLSKQPEVRDLYNEFIKEYEQLGHMHEVKLNQDGIKSSYFMPHHGVFRPESSTTRLRVVFNASAPSKNGKCLNEIFMNGGVVQDQLIAILLRFRLHKYAFSADIQKMFRQIKVDPRDTKLQRILWKDENHALKIFELDTVTYGTVPAPFLATRTIKQMALDFEEKFPLASKVLLQDVYVDDILSGHNNLEIAKKTQVELIVSRS